jgi:Tol biopolymer transport system component
MDRRRVYIRHIPSQEEIVVPSTAKEMFTPTWNLSGELLAYSTRGSIENPESGTDRNIYAYDQVTERVEPICIGEADDAEPAWSPSNPNLLAFSRAEGRHRQIWTVTFNAEGESSEQQFTQYGGDKPVWLLDGTAILYENNGQLWLILNDATDNRPVMIKGRVIFGHEPYVIPQPIP